MKEKIKEFGLILLLFGIPTILYLAVRDLSEKYSFIVFFVVLFFGLWLFENKYEEIKRLKRQINILLEHSNYSSKEKEEILKDLNMPHKENL